MNSDLSIRDVGEHVVEIRLQRPERLNALGVATTAALREAVSDLATRRTRVLLLCGTGRAFCAGADLKERRGMALPERIAHNAAINAAVDELAAAPCVTIAVINGLALGGGCELAMACDLRIAATGVQIGLTESRVGAIPGAGGTQRLPRLVGLGRALQMMLTGEPVTSERAEAIGLVHDVIAHELLDERALALASLLAARSPMGLRTIKELAYRGIDMSLVEGIKAERAAVAKILASTDYAEGLAAFAEKRHPRFGEERAP
jgi:enoyl-CoA hydratase/carnithine racemase